MINSFLSRDERMIRSTLYHQETWVCSNESDLPIDMGFFSSRSVPSTTQLPCVPAHPSLNLGMLRRFPPPHPISGSPHAECLWAHNMHPEDGGGTPQHSGPQRAIIFAFFFFFSSGSSSPINRAAEECVEGPGRHRGSIQRAEQRALSAEPQHCPQPPRASLRLTSPPMTASRLLSRP